MNIKCCVVLNIVIAFSLSFFLCADYSVAQQTEKTPPITLKKTMVMHYDASHILFPYLIRMDSEGTYSRYLPEKNSLWVLAFKKLFKYDFTSNTASTFSVDEERIMNGWNAANEMIQPTERANRIGGSRIDPILMEISPNEKYLLVRYYGQKSELYDIETGRLISNGEKDEVIIGFDRNSNIYCGCQSITNMFVLRDPQTQKIIREYQTERGLKDSYFPFEYSGREGYNPYYDGIQFTNLPSPIESRDGKYTLFFFSTYQLSGKLGIVTVCNNENGDVVARSCIGLGNFSLLKPQFNRNGNQIAILDDINRCFWVYDFTSHSSRSFFIPKSSNRQEIKGYCFVNDNQLITWTRHFISPLYYSSYVFDAGTGNCTTPALCTLTETVYDTSRYYFSPDGKTAITFVFESKKYPPDLDKTLYGKFLFWDVLAQKVIFETEEKYLNSIFIDNDWKTIWISRMEGTEEDADPKVLTEEYDISEIINRPGGGGTNEYAYE